MYSRLKSLAVLKLLCLFTKQYVVISHFLHLHFLCFLHFPFNESNKEWFLFRCCGAVPMLKSAYSMYMYIHGNTEHNFICKKENMKFDMKTQRFFRALHIYHIYWILRFYGMIQKVNDESLSFVQI